MKAPEKQVKLKNGMTVVLKTAEAKDAELLLQHLRISHRESYRNLLQSSQFWETFSIEDEKKILTDFENSKNKFMLVAFYENKIIAGLGLVGQNAEFVKQNASFGMSIQSAYCNSGLGTEILKYALDLAKQAGLRRLDLTVRTSNATGIALYEKLGFKKTGLHTEVAFIDGEYMDEFSYEKILI